MELIERDSFLETLRSLFENISGGEGHCVFVSGEAGIGKTSLIKVFSKEMANRCAIYRGTCDALFTPRPLSPLYDILLQLGTELPENSSDIADRPAFFSRVFHALSNQHKPCVVIFEDIHWADDATLDFIKFFARRITQLRCLCILTYRDNEVHTGHSLRNILGQLDRDSFTRLQLPPLSKQAVDVMAAQRGYDGENVYSISGGNPFYVTEILASYSLGIPDNIKDAVLSAYNRLDQKTKDIWDLVSILPTAFEVKYLQQINPSFATAIENCLSLKILVIDNGMISFKHELFRRAIEISLSPLVRVALNKKVLTLFMENFEQTQRIEQIVHHAKNANEYELVVSYAPVAARKAAALGSHTEAATLYLSAIENYQGNDEDILIDFYESYAYECYLTGQIREAIIYTTRALNIWKNKNDTEKIGNCMRFLSRLWWSDGKRKQAETFAVQAIEVLNNEPPSKAKAMAFSNMSQLKMLFDQPEECIAWGEKAIAIAQELNDDETLSHALNNTGSIQMYMKGLQEKGTALLLQSLEIALKNSFHEHAARAYSNLGSNGMNTRNYELAKRLLHEGIQYCEERDLDSWKSNMLSVQSSLYLETSEWKSAYVIADRLLKNENKSPSFMVCALTVMATVKMRTAEPGALHLLLEAEAMALETMERQRIIPVVIALLEYEWLSGETVIKTEHIDRITSTIDQSIYTIEKNEFAFWLRKARKQEFPLRETYKGYEVNSPQKCREAAAFWEQLNSYYLQALLLFEGDDDDKRAAITIMQRLGATPAYEKLKAEMRSAGIKNIPRGIRKTTQSNPAQLTDRELDILQLLNLDLQNKEIAARLFISAKTVDHHISSILYKLEVNSRKKAVREAIRLEIIK